MKPYNTKATYGKRSFEIEPLPSGLVGKSGLVPLPLIVDMIVGEEIAFYWLDPTPFIEQLAEIKPFQMRYRAGLFRSEHGPLLWMLFFVPDPNPRGEQPFASMECHVNPSDPEQVTLWRRLANQTHWHMTLIGANAKVYGFFEFENTYELDSVLDTMEEACSGMPVSDFMAAKQEFWDTMTMDDLYNAA